MGGCAAKGLKQAMTPTWGKDAVPTFKDLQVGARAHALHTFPHGTCVHM